MFPPAHKNGRFDAELVPMEVKGKKGMEVFSSDEHPREASLEKLATLKAVFKENGMVSAGNASVSIHVHNLKDVVLVTCMYYLLTHSASLC